MNFVFNITLHEYQVQMLKINQTLCNEIVTALNTSSRLLKTSLIQQLSLNLHLRCDLYHFYILVGSASDRCLIE